MIILRVSGGERLDMRHALTISFAFACALVSGCDFAQRDMVRRIEALNIRPAVVESRRTLTDREIARATPVPLPRRGVLKSNGIDDDFDGDEDALAPDDFDEPDDVGRGAPTFIPNPADRRPFRNSGKLVFRTPSGEISWCSAEFVGSDRVLMTAAHCVYDFAEGGPNSDFTFLQAYRDGGYSDRFGVECLAMPDMDELDIAIDYAFLRTDAPSPTGFLPLLTDAVFGTAVATGYPINYWSGERLHADRGVVLSEDLAGIVVMDNILLSNGSSGGAWLIHVTESASRRGNYVVGLNSYTMRVTFMASPDFNVKTELLLNHVRDGSCLP